jgi:hypothetical protein
LCRQRRCARESRLTRQAQRLRPRVARASRWSSPRFARIVFANRENTARQSGRLGTYIPGGPKPPFTPGYELVGVVEELGPGCSRLREGDRVGALTVWGADAERVCVPEASAVEVPEDLDPAEVLSLVFTYMTAYQVLHRTAKVKSGETVLVHGAAAGLALRCSSSRRWPRCTSTGRPLRATGARSSGWARWQSTTRTWGPRSRAPLVVILKKDEDGTLEAFELSDLEETEIGELRRHKRDVAMLLYEDDVAAVAAAIEPGSTAGVLVWENLWAAPFASAVRHSGGQLVASGRIPIQALVPALEADDVEENEGG